MIYFPLRGAGVSNTTLFAPASSVGVTFPGVLPSAIAPGSPLAALVGPPGISYVDPGFGNPRVVQLTASLTRHVAGLSLEAGYMLSESSNLRVGGFRSTSWDRNLAPPTHFDQFGRGVDILAAGRPDPTIGQANALTSFGRGRYQALTVTLSKPLTNRWQFYGNYTLAKSMGNGSTERDTEAEFGPSDPFNLDADYGINELDERHQVKSYLVLTLPRDVTLASTWSAGSGLAFPVYSPTDLNGDGVTNDGLQPDRPVVNGQLVAAVALSSAGLGHVGLPGRQGSDAGNERASTGHPRRLQSPQRRQYLRRSAHTGDPRQSQLPGAQPDAWSAARTTRHPTRFLTS